MHISNVANLGDNLFQFNFMRRACVENRELEIDYYCKSEYHDQLTELIDDQWSNQIRLHPLGKRPVNTLETWIRSDFYKRHPRKEFYNEFYVEWFRYLSEKMGIRCPIRENNDVLMHHPAIAPSNLRADILVINCTPMSDQFDYEPSYWDRAMLKWTKNNQVCALAPTPVLEVFTPKLTLLGIARLACTARTVVSICTGPLHMAFNTVSINTVKSWHIFHKWNVYTYGPNIYHYRKNKKILRIKP